MVDTTQFAAMIGPQNLLDQVRNTAPFLFGDAVAKEMQAAPVSKLIEAGGGAQGFLRIILHADKLKAVEKPTEEQLEEYFALCLAAHHTTVGTFVPTDVDSKIRGHLWMGRSRESARRMFALAQQAMNWDISRVSSRATELSGVGPVSGHNGEMFGVLGGALGSFIRNDDQEFVAEAEEVIATELARERHEFEYVVKLKDHEIDLLQLSMSLLHNFGDLDQGINYWGPGAQYEPWRKRFGRIGHENSSAMGPAFEVAGRLYKKIMSSEGHRHYPLREIRCIRKSADFLLPLGPCFDDWGRTIGTHQELTFAERAEVLTALLSGCKKIKGQVGYYRAISGLINNLSGSIEKLEKLVASSVRGMLKDPLVHQHIALSKISFESSMKKKARAVLNEK